MHDTLIQGCASVSALLEAHSSMEQSNSGYHTDLLDCARTQLRSTLEEAREAVWGLRSISDTSTDIGEMLKKIAEQFIREFGVTVDCSISGEPFALSQSAVHEVVMIAREGLYNAIHHAQPSRIELRLNFERDRCTLTIVDDGSGFDVRVLTQAPECHYGLLGMRERVDRIHGRFILDSTIGKGTEITVEIPRRAVASAASEIAI
jgi:signal transduction histidine kinase